VYKHVRKDISNRRLPHFLVLSKSTYYNAAHISVASAKSSIFILFAHEKHPNDSHLMHAWSTHLSELYYYCIIWVKLFNLLRALVIQSWTTPLPRSRPSFQFLVRECSRWILLLFFSLQISVTYSMPANIRILLLFEVEEPTFFRDTHSILITLCVVVCECSFKKGVTAEEVSYFSYFLNLILNFEIVWILLFSPEIQCVSVWIRTVGSQHYL